MLSLLWLCWSHCVEGWSLLVEASDLKVMGCQVRHAYCCVVGTER